MNSKSWEANFEGVLIYARFFSVIPNYKNPAEKFNWRALANCFVVLTGFLYSEHGRLTLGVWHKPDVVSQMMDTLSYALLTLNNLCIIFNCIFRKRLWRRLLNGFSETKVMMVPFRKRKLGNVLLVYNISVICFLIYGVYVWINTFTIKSAKYWIFLLYQEYHCGVLIYTIVSVNLQFGKQFKEVIGNLDSMVLENGKSDDGDRLKTIKNKVRKSYDLVKIFNDLLGWQMFFIISNSTCTMLDSLLRCVRYLRSDAASHVKGNMLIVSAVLVLAGMVRIIIG